MIPRQERRFGWILMATVALVVGVAWWVPRPVDWSDSFAADDSRPYASDVVRAALPDLFPGSTVRTVTDPPYARLQDTTTASGAYVFVTDQFAPDEVEAGRLLDYVDRGNTVFVAAHHFARGVADTLGLATHPRPMSGADVTGADTVSLYLTGHGLDPDGVRVRAETGAFVLSFSDTTVTNVLGRVKQGDTSHVAFVQRSYGEGQLLVSSTPRFFTNVHALNERTAPYVWGALSHIPSTADPVWWDAYNKPGRVRAETPLRFILSTPPLRNAYVILVLGVVLFLLTNARRRQRAIPVVEPPTNAALEFVETLGRLAHRQGDATKMARRRVTYLLAFVRERVSVQADPEEEEAWIEEMVDRTSLPRDDIAALAHSIRTVRMVDSVSDEQLQALDRRIQRVRDALST